MKNIFIILIFIVNINFCNSQNKIFLPSEEAWVTVVEFSDWIEDNEDDYLGEYNFVYALINDKGEVGDGDGYEEKIQLQKIAGKLVAFSMLNVEGWDETQKDTLHNISITQNYLNSDRPNLKFVTLSYKDKKKKLKKVRGILDFDGEKTDYFFEKSKNSAQGKRDENTNLIDDIGKKISALIPQGAYLREYEKLLDVNEETYIGIYVTDFKDPIILVTPTNQYDPQDLFSNCPEMTQGQPIKSKYFLFAYKSNKIISTVQIPANVYDSNEECSISFYNTPFNNCYYFSFFKKNCKGYRTNILEKTKLIELLDLTGDKRNNEFILTGVQEACGFIDRLSCGFDEETQQVMIYPILHHGEKYYWVARFVPIGGDCTIVVLCDDHFNETYERCDYKFNPETKQYDLVYEETKKCE